MFSFLYGPLKGEFLKLLSKYLTHCIRLFWTVDFHPSAFQVRLLGLLVRRYTRGRKHLNGWKIYSPKYGEATGLLLNSSFNVQIVPVRILRILRYLPFRQDLPDLLPEGIPDLRKTTGFH